eukprot:3195091-Amphidinium_carterae.1
MQHTLPLFLLPFYAESTVYVNGGDDDEEQEPPTKMDYVMHVIALPWKVPASHLARRSLSANFGSCAAYDRN